MKRKVQKRTYSEETNRKEAEKQELEETRRASLEIMHT